MKWKDTIKEEKPEAAWKKTITDADPQEALETFAETALDEALLGYYPQIAAGIKTLGGTAGDYAKQRDLELKELQRGQFESPIASGLGTAAAIGAQMAIPFSGAAKLATLAKTGAPIAKQAAIEGLKGFALGSAISGLKNPGEVTGQIEPLQFEKRLENITSEAPMNAIAGVAGGLIDYKAAKKAAEAPVKIIQALKPTPTKTAVLIKDDAKRAKEVGDFIFEKQIVKVGDSANEILSKAELEVKKAGQKLQNFISSSSKQLDESKFASQVIAKPSFIPDRDLPQMYGDLQKYLADSGYSGSKEIADRVTEQILSDLDSMGEIAKRSTKGTNSEVISMNLEGLNQMKRFMQDQVSSYDKIADTTKDAGALSEAYNYAAKFFSKKVDEEISRFGDDAMGKTLKNLNKQYSLASDARGLAQRNAVKEFTKKTSNVPVMSGLGSSGITYGLTKDPALAALVGTGAGVAASMIQNISPTTTAALSAKIPSMVSRGIIPKSSAIYAAQENTQVFKPEMIDQALQMGVPPFVIEEQAKKMDNLTPSERTIIRQKAAKAAK